MYYHFRKSPGKWIGFICAILIIFGAISYTKAGTILLMGIGLGTPGGSGPPPTCDGAASLAEGCSLTPSIGLQ
jgi:hypothetical protein